MIKHRVTKSIKPKLWYRWNNWAQMGKQPSGRQVVFSRHHGFVGMSVYEGGRMVSHTCRMYPTPFPAESLASVARATTLGELGDALRRLGVRQTAEMSSEYDAVEWLTIDP